MQGLKVKHKLQKLCPGLSHTILWVKLQHNPPEMQQDREHQCEETETLLLLRHTWKYKSLQKCKLLPNRKLLPIHKTQHRHS